MKIIFYFSQNKIRKLILVFSLIIKISFSSKFEPIPKGNGILNMKYNHKSADNLYFIFEHFRHGARSTCEGKFINNTDILGGKWQYVGGLTKLGKKQQYNIGQKNKLRYKKFINYKYDPREIKIYSTNYTRTINSAQNQLLGLFNNHINYDNISNKDIIGEAQLDINLNNIIPPIYLFQYKKEGNKRIFQIFLREKFTCPLFKKNIDENRKKIYYFEKLKNIRNTFNKKYYNIILNEYNIDNTKSHIGMYHFCDAYISNYYDENNKLKLNEIEKRNNNFNLKDILNTCYDYYKEYFFVIEGEKYAKINGILSMSRSFQEIIDIMKDRINKGNQKYINYTSPKFLLYSGHDDTLSQMQMFLKKCFNIEYEWTPFASSQLFELRKYGNIFYVEIYYNDRLKLNITFKEFDDKIKKNIMNEKDIYNKCYGFKNSSYFLISIWLIIISILLFITFFSIKIYIYFEELEKNSETKNISIM